MFDTYIFVDWSANSTPKRGKDSVWVAEVSGDGPISLRNPATRHEATLSVIASLQNAAARKQRVLIGFDFAYAYPLGTMLHIGQRRIEQRQRPLRIRGMGE